MPFGIDLKSFILGFLFGWIGLKYILTFVQGRRTPSEG